MAIKAMLIGGGGMGVMHGKNFAAHPDCELLAVCDMNAERLAVLQKEFPGLPAYASIDELLANCDAELAVMITNETLRVPPCVQLLEAGRHVFTEKPLHSRKNQFNIDDEDGKAGWQVIDAARKSGKCFGIDYNYHYFEHFAKLNQALVGGQIGTPTLVWARAHFNCWSHVIDQILWNMGRPEWVYTIGDCAKENWTRLIHMKWSNGAEGELGGSLAWGYDDGPLKIILCGDKAYGTALGLEGFYTLRKAGSWPCEELERWEGKGAYNDSFVHMADAVIKAMQAGEPMPVDEQAAWDEQVFEGAVYRSAKTGQRVVLDEIDEELRS